MIVGYQRSTEQTHRQRARRLFKQMRGKEASPTKKQMVMAKGFNKTCALILRGLEVSE